MIRDEDLAGPQILKLGRLPWLNGVVNCGLRAGGCYLISGEPGGNKTTLAVQLAASLALDGKRVLMVLTEQTVPEVRAIFGRVLGCTPDRVPRSIWDNVRFELLGNPSELLPLLRRRVPALYPDIDVVMVDSLQGSGLPATATRTYARIYSFVDECKARGLMSVLIAHVSKRGDIAGPRALVHKVDVVLMLRKAGARRQLYLVKNRYGPEVIDPFPLCITKGRLEPSPHAIEHNAVALGWDGRSEELLEIQGVVSIPRLGGRGELVAPFLPAKRIRQIVCSLNTLPGVDLADLSYFLSMFVPSDRGYAAALDLPIALVLLSAYLQAPIPAGGLYIGRVDLLRQIRPPDPTFVSALGDLLVDPAGPQIERVYLPSACAGALRKSVARSIDVIGIRTLDELLALLWPGSFRAESHGPGGTSPSENGG